MARKPVIAFDNTSLPSVTTSECGVVAKDCDYKDLAKIKFLIDNKKKD